ncbi:MAG: helix-turn-helix transcriptional regulator [Clostridia bacterium]|nr:helix-turn-helix transcriptional regulator [Clostridia bacterium]
MNEKKFQSVIKDLLAELNISQEQFAKSIGTTQGTVSKWLNGSQEPRYCQLQKMAIKYNLDTDRILGLTKY